MTAREALGFDVYGTLVDPIRIAARLEIYLPHAAQSIAAIWRQKQLEFSFRLAAMGRYEDFAALTRKALDYALAAAEQSLRNDQKAALLAEYDQLEPFADVVPGLMRLRDAGFTLAVFSNGTPAMLDALLNNHRLRDFFDEIVSVDAVQTYKPAPVVYQHLAARLRRPIGNVRLISSNPFDIVGAQAVGMQAAWINRSNGLFDDLGPRPSMVVASLDELANALIG